MRYESGLKLIHEAFETIQHVKEQVSSLSPRHQVSLTSVAENVRSVESMRLQYIQVGRVSVYLNEKVCFYIAQYPGR